MLPNNTLFLTMSLEDLRKFIDESIKNAFNEISPKNDNEELLTIQEVGQLFRVSTVTIHKWKKNKLIKAYRIGRKIYFKKPELVAAMNFLTNKP